MALGPIHSCFTALSSFINVHTLVKKTHLTGDNSLLQLPLKVKIPGEFISDPLWKLDEFVHFWAVLLLVLLPSDWCLVSDGPWLKTNIPVGQVFSKKSLTADWLLDVAVVLRDEAKYDRAAAEYGAPLFGPLESEEFRTCSIETFGPLQ